MQGYWSCEQPMPWSSPDSWRVLLFFPLLKHQFCYFSFGRLAWCCESEWAVLVERRWWDSNGGVSGWQRAWQAIALWYTMVVAKFVKIAPGVWRNSNLMQSNHKVRCAFFNLHIDDLMATCVFWLLSRAKSTCKRDKKKKNLNIRLGKYEMPPKSCNELWTV